MFGSVTKMYTAASVLRLVEQGLVSLDDQAMAHIDPILRAQNASSMVELFGPSAVNVTVRHLLSMRSGIYDFDDDATRRFCNTHPSIDVSPIDDLWFASSRGRKQPLYPAGSEQDYSSTNFELLGLLLMRHAGMQAWDQFDQRNAAFGPRTSGLHARFPKTRFALRGRCSSWTRVHGYEPDDAFGLGLDTAFMSCTNGFTCGNVAAPASEVADFVHALYAEPGAVLSPASMAEMRRIWEWYGLGTMDLPSYGQTGERYCRLGHFGVTYGFTGNAAYSPSLGYAIAWGTNQEDPGQTRTHGAEYDFLMQFDCELMRAVMGVLAPNQSDALLNCSWAHVNQSQAGACRSDSRRMRARKVTASAGAAPSNPAAAVAAAAAAARPVPPSSAQSPTSGERRSSQPEQTPLQRQLVASARERAAVAAAQAKPHVLERFSSAALRGYLAQLDDGSGLHLLPPSTLVQRFWEEVSAAELVHNFGDPLAARDSNCGFDLSIVDGAEATQFYNQWQLQALGLVPIDGANNVFTEWSETTLFGFPPFANVSRPDMATATDRPFYAALNMYRGAGGNPQCGPVSAVLSRSYVGSEILGAPIDTGFFQGACSKGQRTGKLGNVTVARCDAWPAGARTLGVPPHLDHLLAPYLTFYNQSEPQAGESYPALSLARLLTRLLSRRTYTDAAAPLRLSFVENTLGYFELSPATAIPFGPRQRAESAAASDSLRNGSVARPAVKLLVGMFELLWGTHAGARLQTWAAARGWPLAWAFNPRMSYFRCGPAGDLPSCAFPPALDVGLDTAAVRLLDATVLPATAAHNVSVPDAARLAFDAAWAATNVSSASRPAVAAAWAELVDEKTGVFGPLAIEPLFFGACADEACIGVSVRDRHCVCPATAASPSTMHIVSHSLVVR